MSEVNDMFLTRFYDELSREQQKLMGEFKADVGNTKDLQKHITIINTLCMNVLKLRNFRRIQAEK